MNERTNHFAELLVEDDAYHLISRAVLRVRGRENREALQSLLTHEFSANGRAATYAALVDREGLVAGDLFVVPDGEDLLLDCDRDQAKMWVEYILAAASWQTVEVIDETARWRVFGLLNNQTLFDDGTPYIRYADPRRHELGSRVLRPSDSRESLSWRHEGKWRAHLYRLGVPTTEVFSRVRVTPFEAALHALGALSPLQLQALGLLALDAGPTLAGRRLLPFRVEPSGPGIPAMLGEPVTGGQSEVGRVAAIQGLFGLALIDLAAWRSALERAELLMCAGEQVLVNWPNWLGRESTRSTTPAPGL